MGAGTNGAFGWPGAFGTWWRADPAENMIMIYLIQNSMELGPEAASQLATGQRMAADGGAADVPEPHLRRVGAVAGAGVSKVGIPSGIMCQACLSMVYMASCGPPNWLGSSIEPTLTIARGKARGAGHQVRAALGAELAGDRPLQVAARERLRLTLGVVEPSHRHGHEEVRRAARQVLAFPAMALAFSIGSPSAT